MKKFLIVLNDNILLSVFKSWVFRAQKKDSILLTKNSKEAVDIIEPDIDFFVAELNWNEIENLELLAGLSCFCPTIKVIIMIPSTSASIKEKLDKLTSFSFIEKPNTLKELTNIISMLETDNFKAKLASNMLLTDFLQLVEIYKSTCLLSIENKENTQKGFIYFENGILYDAIYNDLRAEPAVIEILTWTHATIHFKLLEKKKFSRKINNTINELLNRSNTVTEQAEIPIFSVLDDTTPNPNNTLNIIEEQNNVEFDALRIKIDSLALDNEILELLKNTAHCQAFIIFNMKGDVLIEQHIAEYDAKSFGLDIVIMIKSTLDTFTEAGLGIPNYIQVNADSGIFSATWILENKLLAAMFLTPDANLGLAKLKLNKTSEAIHKKLDL